MPPNWRWAGPWDCRGARARGSRGRKRTGALANFFLFVYALGLPSSWCSTSSSSSRCTRSKLFGDKFNDMANAAEAHVGRKLGVDTARGGAGGGGGGNILGGGGGGGDVPGGGRRYQPGVRREPLAVRTTTAEGRDGSYTILVRTWLCSDCGYGNWPSRGGCRICNGRRNWGERRKDDFWAPDKLPDGAERELEPPSGARSGGGGGGGGRASDQHQHHQQQQRRLDDPSRRVPGAGAALRPKAAPRPLRPLPARPRPRSPSPPSETDVDCTDDDGRKHEGNWAEVVTRGMRRNRKRSGRLASGTDVRGDEQHGQRPPRPPAQRGEPRGRDADGRDGDGDPAHPPRLPPPVAFDVPMVPIRWIKDRRQSLAKRAEAARAQGGDASKAQRAEEAEKRLGEWVRQVGATDQAVANKLRACKGKLDRSDKAIVRVSEDIKAAEREIVTIQGKISRLQLEERTHRERRDALAVQVRYLSSQVYAAALPPKEDGLRIALQRMEELGDPALRAAMDLLAPMVAPAADALATFHIAVGDTSSDDGGDDDISIDGDAIPPGPGLPSDALGSGAASLLAELDEARRLLSEAQGARDEELYRAQTARRRKRHVDADEPKHEHDDGDVEMVAVLTEHQIEEKHAARIQQASHRVQDLASRIKDHSELIPPPGPTHATPAATSSAITSSSSPTAPPCHAGSSSSGIDRSAVGDGEAAAACLPQFSPELAARRAAAQRLCDQIAADHDVDCQRADDEEYEGRRVEMEQERAQQQQEQELQERLHREEAAALRRDRLRRVHDAASEIEANRGMSMAEVYGPTGQNLEEQQRAMLQVCSGGAEGPRRPPRWGRPSSSGRERATRHKSPSQGRRARTKSPRPLGGCAASCAD